MISKSREYLHRELEALGFVHTPSLANFVFAKSNKISGEELYTKLKEKGILVRHFDTDRISDYNRITVGSKEECEALVAAIKEIFKEKDI